MAGGLRVLVVEDDPFTRALLVGVLATFTVAEAGTVPHAMDIAASTVFDAAVVDLDLGGGPTGIDLAHGLRRLHPSIGIIVLSTYPEPRLLGQNLPALPEGSRYMTKQSISDPSQLAAAVTAIARSDSGETRAEDRQSGGLSDTQVEVMRLVAAGYSNAEIARRLSIEEASVEKAIARLIRQLDVKADRQRNQRVLIAQAYHRMTGSPSVRQD